MLKPKHFVTMIAALTISMTVTLLPAMAATQQSEGAEDQSTDTVTSHSSDDTRDHDDKVQSSKEDVNPFTGDALALEDLQREFKLETLKAKIDQAKYKRQRFQNQIKELQGASTAANNGKGNKAQQQLLQQISSLKTKVADMGAHMADLKAAQEKPDTDNATKQTHASQSQQAHKKPELLAVMDTNNHGLRGMIAYNDTVKTVASGEKIGPYRVSSISWNQAILTSRGGRTVLAIDHNPGHITVAGASNSGLNSGKQTGSAGVNSRLRNQSAKLTAQLP